MSYKTITLALAACISLAACAAADRDLSAARQWRMAENLNTGETTSATNFNKANCVFLGPVAGTTAKATWFSGQNGVQAAANAKRGALSKGATHIIWDNDDITMGSNTVHGDAYKCQ